MSNTIEKLKKTAAALRTLSIDVGLKPERQKETKQLEQPGVDDDRRRSHGGGRF